MTSDVAARITQHADKPGWWVAAAREEAARRDGRAKPYSQMELAFAIGRDRNTIWRWETGEIDYFSWVGVLAILGLDLDWEPPKGATKVAPTKPRRSTSKSRPH